MGRGDSQEPNSKKGEQIHHLTTTKKHLPSHLDHLGGFFTASTILQPAKLRTLDSLQAILTASPVPEPSPASNDSLRTQIHICNNRSHKKRTSQIIGRKSEKSSADNDLMLEKSLFFLLSVVAVRYNVLVL
jgi:hypothetical protein